MHLQALWLVDSCVSIKARSPQPGMVCAVCPGLHGVTIAGRILKLRDLKLREDGHLRVTNACTTQTVRQFNRHQRSKSNDPIPVTAINCLATVQVK
jgi:hypothetical protein